MSYFQAVTSIDCHYQQKKGNGTCVSLLKNGYQLRTHHHLSLSRKWIRKFDQKDSDQTPQRISINRKWKHNENPLGIKSIMRRSKTQWDTPTIPIKIKLSEEKG